MAETTARPSYYRLMDLKDASQNMSFWLSQKLKTGRKDIGSRAIASLTNLALQVVGVISSGDSIGNLILKLLWHLVHIVISIYYSALCITRALESNLISRGVINHYRALDIGKIRYLAIAFDSEDAHKTSKVIELLLLLTAIGVKRVCLYDTEGVLKKSKNTVLEKLPNASLFEDTSENDSLCNQKNMILEFASFSDGKETVVKAANLIFTKYMKLGSCREDEEDKFFTEHRMDEALRAVGCRTPDPDLLLVYGPVRCHLGFPAWRIRYTEIVHMGPLKSMRYGSLLKAIDKFTKVHQNYGK